MAIYKNTPPIVTSGLVLHLDAANFRSYTSGSTKWVDLTTQIATGSLVNGPAYNSDVGGNIQLDGSNDYINFYAPNLTTTTTVELWTKMTYVDNSALFYWGSYGIFASGQSIGYNTGNSDIYGIAASIIVGNWNHCIFEMRSDVVYTNNRIYVNGIRQTITIALSTELVSNRNFNSGFGRIGASGGGGLAAAFYGIANHSIFRVYNRALTTNEIAQNYNALKSRYNLS